MAITDYASLQVSIAQWLHRDDIDALIPDFIQLAEIHLSDDVKARDMETRAGFTVSTGSQYAAVPTDLKKVIRVSLSGDPAIVLKYAAPDKLLADFPSASSGKPCVYTLIGGEMQVAPNADAEYTGEIVYRQSITPLSDTDTTNWLLTKYPNAYLFASLVAAQFYIEDENRFMMIQAAYDAAINNINSADWGSGSTMAVRAG